MYLRETPATLSKHLEQARDEGWSLGAKLVRGAYMGSDPRGLFWATKQETDRCYDGCAAALMRRQWDGKWLKQTREHSSAFPEVELVLATHNLASVKKAIAIRQAQANRGEARIPMVYAQLMGMADHVSAEAIQAGRAAQLIAQEMNENNGLKGGDSHELKVEMPKVYKYLVWGSVGECMRYLVRRAEENRDAVQRTVESRKALVRELQRRVFG